MKLTTASLAILVAFFACLTGCEQKGESSTIAAAAPSALTVEKRREWASRLAAEGLKDQALAAYEEILDRGEGLSDALVVGLSVAVADIHLEKGRYEQALASLFRAKLFEVDSKLDRQIEEKRILCLEKLGRTGAASKLLDKVTSVDKKDDGAAGVGGEVLAEVGDDTVTRADLDGFLAEMPPEMQGEIKKDNKQLDVLKSLVARKVLVRRAKKLGLDSDATVRRAMDMAGQEILVRKVIADDVAERVKIDPEDVKLYFDAHPERFNTPAEIELEQIVVKDEAAEAKVREALRSGTAFGRAAKEHSVDEKTKDSGGRIEGAIVEGRFHPEFIDVGEVFAACGGTATKGIAPRAVVTSKGRHILRVLSKKDAVVHGFEESKDRAASMLRSEREQAALQAILEDATKSSDVKLHTEKL